MKICKDKSVKELKQDLHKKNYNPLNLFYQQIQQSWFSETP